ncbi:nuclear factor erythroid 2-related factor 3 isoform X5 [Pipistrellus kuhlii]|uniref:nuclear factor erythroid 2-related factor 3 isoform X5 n=1 Tax=Pipistrellus kuhlii TaxID=59472 RepID=UPI001E26F1DC|nr:nuclear factor erythroid 2-related factor 3 isoform X5 [Pipistrellus kuhlii]
MKFLKPWWSDGGGLLHLTVLLGLAGLHRDPDPDRDRDLDLDLDLYLLLPPRAPLRDELLLWGRPSPASALSPFPAPGGWGRAEPPLPKGRGPEPAGRLLRAVRALGAPFIPRTRVHAWLVHGVAAGDPDGAHGLLGAAAASAAGGGGAGADGGSQAALGGGGDPRAAPSSPLAAGEEEEAPAEPTARVPDASGRASQTASCSPAS